MPFRLLPFNFLVLSAPSCVCFHCCTVSVQLWCFGHTSTAPRTHWPVPSASRQTEHKPVLVLVSLTHAFHKQQNSYSSRLDLSYLWLVQSMSRIVTCHEHLTMSTTPLKSIWYSHAGLSQESLLCPAINFHFFFFFLNQCSYYSYFLNSSCLFFFFSSQYTLNSRKI